VNALRHPRVGQYINRHFVSAFQKVATFQIDGAQKQGGNVAAYFCTPAGRVLHAVAGPTDADTFLREARWANETYHMAQLESATTAQLQAFLRKAHLIRLQGEHGYQLFRQLPDPESISAQMVDRLLADPTCQPLSNQGKVHLLCAASPRAPLGQVYQVVFERILNERISTNPVVVAGR